MKRIITALLTLSIMMMLMTNIVFAQSLPPIPWSEDFQDIPFSPDKDRNGQDIWRYYKEGEGLVRNRWVQGPKGDWFYCGEDGLLLKNTWLHDLADGKYYYLGDDWAMLHDTTTPDGYTVGPDGAWVKDGQVVIEEVAETAASN